MKGNIIQINGYNFHLRFAIPSEHTFVASDPGLPSVGCLWEKTEIKKNKVEKIEIAPPEWECASSCSRNFSNSTLECVFLKTNGNQSISQIISKIERNLFKIIK